MKSVNNGTVFALRLLCLCVFALNSALIAAKQEINQKVIDEQKAMILTSLTPITASQLSHLMENTNPAELHSFKTFIQQISTQQAALFENAQQDVLANYLQDNPLSPAAANQMQRLFGLYTRLKYADQALALLAKLVAIPTFKDEQIESHNNPHFLKLARVLQDYATQFDLQFVNLDNRVYEVSFDTNKAADHAVTADQFNQDFVGLHAHADVVPVNPTQWVLPDGTQLDPFKMTQIDGRLYGRGTEDDKNGIVITLFAMKAIQEEGISLLRNFKLLIDTTEETTSTAIPYYFARHPTPVYNLALDGSYPVVIAEKGSGKVYSDFALRNASGEGIEFTHITGGLAVNQIPAVSIASIISAEHEQTIAALSQQADKFVTKYGDDFSFDFVSEQNLIKMTLRGVSAHSSTPETGVNPVSRMLAFIYHLKTDDDSPVKVKDNHITDAANYAHELWGLGFYGKKIGIDFDHPFMGPLTTSITLININQQRLRLAVNIRLPVGKTIAELTEKIKEKIAAFQQGSDIQFALEISMKEPMYRNPEGKWVNALLDVATQNLNLPREFGASSGGTSVHFLPNGVQFGLSMPDEKYTGHNANEFKRVEQFLLDLQIVTEMIARIGQMPELD